MSHASLRLGYVAGALVIGVVLVAILGPFAAPGLIGGLLVGGIALR